MGMTTKYSKPLFGLAEYFDAIIDDEEAVLLSEDLSNIGNEISELEMKYDKLRKTQSGLKVEVYPTEWNNMTFYREEIGWSIALDYGSGDRFMGSKVYRSIESAYKARARIRKKLTGK